MHYQVDIRSKHVGATVVVQIFDLTAFFFKDIN